MKGTARGPPEVYLLSFVSETSAGKDDISENNSLTKGRAAFIA